jgi:hypothetical protein
VLTFDPTVALIATIALPCAAILSGAAALVAAVRRRPHRATVLGVMSSVCVLGTFFAATIVAHAGGLIPPA